MNDELKLLASMFGISALAAASRSILSEEKRTIGGFLRGLVLAAFVGTIVGLIIQDYNYTPTTQGGIVGICAFVADDLLMVVLAVTGKLRKNPTIIIDYFINRTGGGKS